MRLRRVGRAVGYTAAALTVLLALTVEVSAQLVRSPRLLAWARPRLEAILDEKLHARVRIGRLDGDLLSAITLHDVELRDHAGRFVGRAARVLIAYRPLSLLTHHKHFTHIWVLAPDAVAEPLVHDRVKVREVLAELRRRQRTLTVDDLRLYDARVRLRPFRGPVSLLEHVHAVARFRLRHHSRYGVVQVAALDGSLRANGERRDFDARGELSWDPRTRARIERVDVRAGKTRVAGHARLARDRVDAEITRLHIDDRDAHLVAPIENAPAPLDARLSAHGPLDAVALDVHLRPGDGTVHLRGRANWHRRLLEATLDHHRLDGRFFPRQPKFVISARVRLRVRLVRGGLTGPAEIEHGSGRLGTIAFTDGNASALFYRDSIDFARAAMDVPGAVASGHAHVTFHGLVHVGVRLEIRDARTFHAAVKGGNELPSPPRQKGELTVEATLDKQKKQKAEWHVTAVGLGRPVARGKTGEPL